MFVTVKLNKILFFILVLCVVVMAVLFLVNSPSRTPAINELACQCIPTLIIDPGHGGEDGGAVSVDGTHESKINLDISLRAAALADFMGLPNELTRTSEKIDYPDTAKTIAKKKRYDQKSRVAFINGAENPVVISVHQNCFPSSRAHGPQSFYAKTDTSDILGKLVQGCLDSTICPDNRRVAMPVAEKIYLMKSITCPAVLVECGFISNATEAKLLSTDEYRLKIATALICAYGQFLEEKPT